MMSGTSRWLRNEEGRLRWYVWLVLTLALGFLLLSLFALRIDSYLFVGRVESMQGSIAVVSLAESNRSVTVESIDPDLKVGDTVIVGVNGEDAELKATAPWMVDLIVRFKELVP
jgi:hypothetical protein